MNFWHFVVLRRDLLSETEVLQTENVYKSGPYDPEMYRFPEYNIKELLATDPDVTNQLLNSALALDTPGKGCPIKNRTHIRSYCINSVSFCGKSIRSAKSRHDENSKLVKQVYMVQKLPPGSLIRHKTFFCEN